MTIVNTTVWYLKVVKRVNPTNSHHKEKTSSLFFSSFFLLSIEDDGC